MIQRNVSLFFVLVVLQQCCSASDSNGPALITAGKMVFEQYNCGRCHRIGDSMAGERRFLTDIYEFPSTGPVFDGPFWGQPRQVFAQGKGRRPMVLRTMDEDYVYESITEANAVQVAGYRPMNLSYDMPDLKLEAITAYIRSLSSEPEIAAEDWRKRDAATLQRIVQLIDGSSSDPRGPLVTPRSQAGLESGLEPGINLGVFGRHGSVIQSIGNEPHSILLPGTLDAKTRASVYKMLGFLKGPFDLVSHNHPAEEVLKGLAGSTVVGLRLNPDSEGITREAAWRVGHFTNLTSFEISHRTYQYRLEPDANAELAESLRKLTKLRTLSMTHFTNDTLMSLDSLKELRFLRVITQRDFVSREALDKMANLPALEQLILYSAIGDSASLRQLRTASNLSDLTIQVYRDDEGAALADLKQLSNLTVGGPGLTQKFLTGLARSKTLHHLKLSDWRSIYNGRANTGISSPGPELWPNPGGGNETLKAEQVKELEPMSESLRTLDLTLMKH
ncbi:MAG: hypothetical protein AAF483_03735, partial [Planctomycetota bacterium]